MCGIYVSVSPSSCDRPTPHVERLLQCRGPDSYLSYDVHVQHEIPGTAGLDSGEVYITAIASVLALRGDYVTPQPLVDQDSGSFLCWNGEAWRIADTAVVGNDAVAVFKLLHAANICSGSQHDNPAGPAHACGESAERVISAIHEISGPFAFVFYDGRHKKLFFGRDCLGRRSLLCRRTDAGSLLLASVVDTNTEGLWEEVDADEIGLVDLRKFGRHGPAIVQEEIIPAVHPSLYLSKIARSVSNSSPDLTIPPLNMELPSSQVPNPSKQSPPVSSLEQELRRSMEARILHVPPSSALILGSPGDIAILFSGGLDCTVLARLCDDILPRDQAVHLLNVAFENPRVVMASKATKSGDLPWKDADSALLSPYELCPDRVTGRRSHLELQETCPSRVWVFVAVSRASFPTQGPFD